jgi:ATP-binding cassette subfamily B protein
MLALIGISNLVVIYFGGLMYIEGTIKSIGTIAEFILYVNAYLACSLIRLGIIDGSSRSFTKRLNEFLKIEPEIKNNPNKSIINGSISFKNATLMKIQI